MKRAVAAVMLSAALMLTGCQSAYNQDESEINRLKNLRDTCEEAGGVFRQWTGGFGQLLWQCDLASKEGDR